MALFAGYSRYLRLKPIVSLGREFYPVALFINDLDQPLPNFRQIPDPRGYNHDLPATSAIIRNNFAETLDNFADNLQTPGRCRVPTRVRRNLPVEP